MQDPQVWSQPDGEAFQVVVFKEGVFYGGTVETKLEEFASKIEDGEDPAELLGKKCQQAPLDDITRVIANNTANLVLESDGKVLLKSSLAQEGVKVLEAIQDEKGRGWEADVQSKARIGSALIALAIAIVMGGGMVWAYFGVVSGEIRRIHWLFAWLINMFGPIVLLITAALIVIGCMAAFGYYLTHPAEVWTLEEE